MKLMTEDPKNKGFLKLKDGKRYDIKCKFDKTFYFKRGLSIRVTDICINNKKIGSHIWMPYKSFMKLGLLHKGDPIFFRARFERLGTFTFPYDKQDDNTYLSYRFTRPTKIMTTSKNRVFLTNDPFIYEGYMICSGHRNWQIENNRSNPLFDCYTISRYIKYLKKSHKELTYNSNRKLILKALMDIFTYKYHHLSYKTMKPLLNDIKEIDNKDLFWSDDAYANDFLSIKSREVDDLKNAAGEIEYCLLRAQCKPKP